jgi:hypothetical protein
LYPEAAILTSLPLGFSVGGSSK